MPARWTQQRPNAAARSAFAKRESAPCGTCRSALALFGYPQRSTWVMCDYSLHNIASRPAKVGDRLVSTNFVGTITRGFAAISEPNVAVCLLPGTEIAFDRDVSFYNPFSLPIVNMAMKVARFRQVD